MNELLLDVENAGGAREAHKIRRNVRFEMKLESLAIFRPIKIHKNEGNEKCAWKIDTRCRRRVCVSRHSTSRHTHSLTPTDQHTCFQIIPSQQKIMVSQYTSATGCAKWRFVMRAHKLRCIVWMCSCILYITSITTECELEKRKIYITRCIFVHKFLNEKAVLQTQKSLSLSHCE